MVGRRRVKSRIVGKVQREKEKLNCDMGLLVVLDSVLCIGSSN